jgi:hypothetical protein
MRITGVYITVNLSDRNGALQDQISDLGEDQYKLFSVRPPLHLPHSGNNSHIFKSYAMTRRHRKH